MSSKFFPNEKNIKKLNKKLSRGLNLAADLIAQRINPQVPFKTGALSQSAFQNGKRVPHEMDSSILKIIGYTVPYAKKVYYGEYMNFTRDKHPEARAYWGKQEFENNELMEKIFAKAYKHVGGE